MDTNANPDLLMPVKKDSELKSWIVDYVGDQFKPEDGSVTVEMVIQAMATEFPEILLAVAEENWIRGYQQGLMDQNVELQADEK